MKRKTSAVFLCATKKEPADVFSQVSEELLAFCVPFNESVVLLI